MFSGSNINYRLILSVIGRLLLVESVVLFSVIFVSLVFDESDWRFFAGASFVALLVGIVFMLLGRRAPDRVGKREGVVIVTFVWVVFSLIGALPFWLSKSIPSYTDAYFETISGFTTTGASILNNIEELSHGMLFWRSLTQWLGGLGIIVISLALLPVFGISGMQLFAAETTGPTKDKIHPKISETAKRLFTIYIALTLIESVLLYFGGMSVFDAVCHSLTTIASGGFSTKQASVAYFNSAYIEYVIAIFMILAGVNFSLFYFGFKRKFSKIKENEEFKYYLYITLLFSLIILISIIDFDNISLATLEEYWRDSIFMISSMLTTTGFATVDYMHWPPVTWIVIAGTMMIGASAGSTAGGIKVVRIIISTKAFYYEFKRLVHPTAVIPIRYNKHVIKDDIVTRILAFVLLYVIVIFIGVFVLAMSGMDMTESIGGMITCVGCVGPGFGSLSPSGSFSHIPEFGKWVLTFAMLIGRLELYTVLMLFTPAFWKK
ncbi:MAG: TrkH family potassium uptake protein [Paludibacteraceae bacterium]